MEDGLLVVSVGVTEGATDAFHAWHRRHVREVVTAVPAIVAARRYALTSPPPSHTTAAKESFLTVYEVTGGDTAEAREALRKAGEDGLVSPPPVGVVAAAATLEYLATDPEVR